MSGSRREENPRIESRHQIRSDEVLPHIDNRFAARVLFVFGIGALFMLAGMIVVYAANVLIVGFAGVLMALVIFDMTQLLEKRLPLPHILALVIVLLLIALVLGLVGQFLVPRIAEQISQLEDGLPTAWQHLHQVIASHPTYRHIEHYLPPLQDVISGASSLAARAGSLFSSLLGMVTNAVIITFIAIYLAASPKSYTENVLKLLPPAQRPHGRAVLHQIGSTLTLWLRGKLLSMVIIGCATGGGLMLIGVPLALTLGILAGLLDFIPYIGPILAAAPAVLLAFTQEPSQALMVIGLFVVLQSLEGYLLLPLVERKTVSLPPALNVMMQVLMGLAFGLAGVAVAAPLAAVLSVLITILYVQDVLDDQVEQSAQHGKESS